MRAVLQRVSSASVSIHGDKKSETGTGLLILLGIEHNDSEEDIDWLTRKIVNMRIFPDDEGVMNRSVTDVNGEVLVVSQFTLHASVKKGNRPSYIRSAGPDFAVPLYESFNRRVGELLGRPVQTGEFGAEMKVALVNDGPVTILLDSRNKE